MAATSMAGPDLNDVDYDAYLANDRTLDDPDVRAGKPLHAVNRWPELPGFRVAVEDYQDAMMALGNRLLGPLALCLGLKRRASAPKSSVAS